MKKFILEVFKNVMGKDCFISVVTKKVDVSVVVKDLDVRVYENKICIHEEGEMSTLEVEYETFEVEDLSEPDGIDMMIRIGDGEYMEITSLVD